MIPNTMKTPKLETITPAIAEQMLKLNTRNLPLRRQHVDFLTSEMLNGRWHLTHQGIAFDKDILVDGQHRLHAVVKSGVTIQQWVYGDVPLAVQEVIDTHRTRSLADSLSTFHGVTESLVKTAICRQLISFCCGFQAIKSSVGRCKWVMAQMGSDIDFVLEATKTFKPAQKAWLRAALVFAISADQNVRPFVTAFGGGENLKHGDPAKALRDWVTNGSRNITSSYKRRAVECVLNAAFNAVKGNRLTTIKSGSHGMAYFFTQNKEFVSAVRDDAKQQMAILGLSAK